MQVWTKRRAMTRNGIAGGLSGLLSGHCQDWNSLPRPQERSGMQGFGLIIEELGPGTVRIALHGELDLAHAYTFDEGLPPVEGARPPCVVLALGELPFVDPCGLSRLLAARRRARRAGHRLLLVRGPAAI